MGKKILKLLITDIFIYLFFIYICLHWIQFVAAIGI